MTIYTINRVVREAENVVTFNGVSTSTRELIYVKGGEKDQTITKEHLAKKDSPSRVKLAELEDKVDGLNRMMEPNYTNLKFNVHETLDRIYVQVLDKNTEEIIREIPPEKFLDMVASMLEFVGLLVDERI